MKQNDTDNYLKALAYHVSKLESSGQTVIYDYMLLELLKKLDYVVASEYYEGWIVQKRKPMSH